MFRALYQFLRRRQAKAAAFLAALLLAASPVQAASPLHPADIAGPHCKALVTALNREDADPIPDMGFVIGGRWDVLTRAERLRISEGIVGRVKAEWGSPPLPAGFRGCGMEISIRLLPADAMDTAGPPEKYGFPRSAAYRATARTALSDEPHPFMLTYILQNDPGYIWEIKELTVNGTPLAAAWGPAFNAILAKSGAKGLLAHLEKPENP